MIYTNPLRTWDLEEFRHRFKDHLNLNLKYGFGGSLLFTSANDPFDPWSMAHLICNNSTEEPLIAVNPIYMHPFMIAWKVNSIMSLYNRGVSINWISGLSKSELVRLGDKLEKNERFERLKECIEIVNLLFNSNSPVSFKGKYYQVENCEIRNKAKYKLVNFIAGESDYTTQLAKELELNQLVMLKEKPELDFSAKSVCFGLFVEDDLESALYESEKFFSTEGILGKKVLELSMLNTDSEWKKRLFNELKNSQGLGYNLNALLKFGETPFWVGTIDSTEKMMAKLRESGVENFVITLAREKDYKSLKHVKELLSIS